MNRISGTELSVLSCINTWSGADGITCEQVKEITELDVETVRVAISLLTDKGFVRNGETVSASSEGRKLLREFHTQHLPLDVSSRTLLRDSNTEIAAICIKRIDWPFYLLNIEKISRLIRAGATETLYRSQFASQEDCWEEANRWWAHNRSRYEKQGGPT